MQNCRWAHRNTVNLIQGLVKVSKGAQGHTDNPFAQLCRVCWCTWGEGWAWKEVVVFIAVACFWLCKLVCHFYHWAYVWAGMGGEDMCDCTQVFSTFCVTVSRLSGGRSKKEHWLSRWIRFFEPQGLWVMLLQVGHSYMAFSSYRSLGVQLHCTLYILTYFS